MLGFLVYWALSGTCCGPSVELDLRGWGNLRTFCSVVEHIVLLEEKDLKFSGRMFHCNNMNKLLSRVNGEKELLFFSPGPAGRVI